MSTAHINDIDIYYEEHGDPNAEPCLLIMGFMTNAGGWAGQIPVLAERYRVIAFDNRGCGRSSQPAGPYTMAQLADDAVGVLDHLGIATAHIIGASMGGMIAQELTLRHPDRVRTLSLLCTTPGGPKAYGYERMNEMAPVLEGAADMSALQTPEALQESMLAMFTPEFLAKPNEAFQQTAVTTLQFPPTIDGVRGQYAAVMGFDALERDAQIRKPTLILAGTDDGLVDARNSQLIADRIPGAELRLFEGLRHGFNVESPELINGALLEFLSKHAAVAAAR